MQAESLSCNNCGAPIDVSLQANFATCTHCGSRLAIRRTNSASYTETLERLDKTTSQMSEELETIRQQNELEQVDREWQMEREQYLVHNDKSGSARTPSTGGAVGAVIVGVVMVVFALFWIGMATAMTGGFGASSSPGLPPGYPLDPKPSFVLSPLSCFPLFGVVFLLMVVVSVIVYLSKASRYSQAQQNYQRRRNDVLRRFNRKR